MSDVENIRRRATPPRAPVCVGVHAERRVGEKRVRAT